MNYPHALNPNDYQGKTQLVLQLMLADEYTGNNIADVNIAFNGLYERFNKIGSNLEFGFKDPQCREILQTVHTMAGLWADLWLARGEETFNAKLNHYFLQAQHEKAFAHDQLLYEALLAKTPNPNIRQLPR
jgi:hypothetical protein